MHISPSTAVTQRYPLRKAGKLQEPLGIAVGNLVHSLEA
jgi:hypothetical protein